MQHLSIKFKTLDGKTYSVNPNKYRITWGSKSASKFQYSVERYFYYLWKNDLVCREFPVKPYIFQNYRADLVNVSTKIVIEAHHFQHIKYSSFFFKSEEDFWKSIERDSLKKETFVKNGFSVVEIYPNNMPLSLDWLKQKYPNIRWPYKHPKE